MKELSSLSGIPSEKLSSTDFSEEQAHAPLLYSIIEYLQENNPQFTPTKLEFVTVVTGILQGISCVAKITKENIAAIYAENEAEVTALIARMTWGQDNLGKYGLKLVDVEFLSQILKVYTDNLDMVKAALAVLEPAVVM